MAQRELLFIEKLYMYNEIKVNYIAFIKNLTLLET
jgi:hypothetical protein